METTALLSTAQAAERLGVSERTMRRLMKAGRVRYVKVTDTLYRIDPDELARYIEARGRGGDAA